MSDKYYLLEEETFCDQFDYKYEQDILGVFTTFDKAKSALDSVWNDFDFDPSVYDQYRVSIYVDDVDTINGMRTRKPIYSKTWYWKAKIEISDLTEGEPRCRI